MGQCLDDHQLHFHGSVCKQTATHTEAALAGVNVTNMATKSVDLFFGGGRRVDIPNLWIKYRNVDNEGKKKSPVTGLE